LVSVFFVAFFDYRNGSIDLLMADAPILDYYRATDHGCTLRQIGDNYIEDTYVCIRLIVKKSLANYI
jgi:hypothetical protein